MYRCAPPSLGMGQYDPYTDSSVVGHAEDGSPLWLPWKEMDIAVVVGIPPRLSTPFSHHVLHGMVGWAQVIRGWLPIDHVRGEPLSDYGLHWPEFRKEDGPLLPRKVFMNGPLSTDMSIKDFVVCLALGATLPPRRDRPWEDIKVLATVETVEDVPEVIRGKGSLIQGSAAYLNNLL